MLDFYLIYDDETTPSYPEKAGLEYAGGVSFVTFENLKNKGIVDDHYDYYSDFRWNSKLIKQMREKIIQINIKNDNGLRELIELMDKAFRNKSGLIAFCD